MNIDHTFIIAITAKDWDGWTQKQQDSVLITYFGGMIYEDFKILQDDDNWVIFSSRITEETLTKLYANYDEYIKKYWDKNNDKNLQ